MMSSPNSVRVAGRTKDEDGVEHFLRSDHPLLSPKTDIKGAIESSRDFLITFKDYPQRQKAASFNLDDVLAKLKESGGAH